MGPKYTVYMYVEEFFVSKENSSYTPVPHCARIYVCVYLHVATMK